MTEKDFKSEIKNGLNGGYLIYGDEEFLKEHYVERAKKSVVGDDDFSPVNTVESDENSYSGTFLEDALYTVPMMAEKVCVIFRVRYSSLKEDEKEALLSSLEKLKDAPQIVLLFVIPSGYFEEGNLKKNQPSPDYRALTKYLVPVSVNRQTPAVLRSWAAKHFTKDGLTVPDDALFLLVDTVGTDMTALSGEIEKLTCYALAKGRTYISSQDVAAICSDNRELDAYALSNSIVAGEREKALEALRECRDKKLKPLYVLAMMTSEFANMMSISIYMRKGMNRADISSKMSMHEFRVGKYMEALKDVEPAAIRAVLERCAQTDEALKNSEGGFDLLERFVCTIPSRKKIMRGYR